MVIIMAMIVLLVGLLVIVLVTTISMLMGSIDVFPPLPNLQPPGCRLFLKIKLSGSMNIEYYTYYGYSIYFLQYNCVISFCILQNAVQKQDLRWYFAAVSLNISAKCFFLFPVCYKNTHLCCRSCRSSNRP